MTGNGAVTSHAVVVGLVERVSMARKPNYKFERMERERAKSARKAARLEAKKEKAEKRKAGIDGLDLAMDDDADAPEGASDQSRGVGDPL